MQKIITAIFNVEDWQLFSGFIGGHHYSSPHKG
jgi:hypothetical protein